MSLLVVKDRELPLAQGHGTRQAERAVGIQEQHHPLAGREARHIEGGEARSHSPRFRSHDLDRQRRAEIALDDALDLEGHARDGAELIVGDELRLGAAASEDPIRARGQLLEVDGSNLARLQRHGEREKETGEPQPRGETPAILCGHAGSRAESRGGHVISSSLVASTP